MSETIRPKHSVLSVNYADFSPQFFPKYSENLYKFIKKNRNWDLRFYYSPTDLKEFDVRFLSASGVYLGFMFDGELNGSRLSEVLAKGARASGWCFAGQSFTEIEGFWERYRELGKCALDPHHTFYGGLNSERFEVNGNTRTCRWCGAQQHLKKTERVVIDKRWVINEETIR